MQLELRCEVCGKLLHQTVKCNREDCPKKQKNRN